jgi:GH43 family beta-xylosidase
MGRRIIEQLHPGKTTPETFCAMLLQHADEMENIVSVVEWKSGRTEIFQTTMNNRDVAWIRHVFIEDFKPD